MVRRGSSDADQKSEADHGDAEAASNEKEGWLSGWGLSGLPVLSDVVNKTSSIVHKTGSVVYQTVEKTTTAVNVLHRSDCAFKFVISHS